MRKARLLIVLSLLAAWPARADTLQQNYLGVYLAINDAQHQAAQKNYIGALVRYEAAASYLSKMSRIDPNWETALVTRRIQDCQALAEKTRPLAAKQLDQQNGEWTPDAGLLSGSGGIADVLRAQAKLTPLELMRDNHPDLKAQLDKQIHDAEKTLDDAEDTALQVHWNA
jgi:hypothetical protein